MNHSKLVGAVSLAMAAMTGVGCSLIKVNGKPLGGGSSGSSAPTGDGSSSSAAGAPVASGVRPTWCAEYSYSDSSSNTMSWFSDMSPQDLESNSNVGKMLAEVVCATRLDNAAEREPLMALRARWMTQMGYDELDFQVVAGQSKGYVDDSQDLTTFAGPVAQLADGYAAQALVDLDQLGARASMLARFSALDRCYQPSMGLGHVDEMPLLLLIQCSREPLDVGKAYAEIDKTEGLNPGTRHRLRRMVKQTSTAAAKAAALVTAKAKEDPGIAQLVAIADAQRKEWAAPSATRAKLIAQLEAMEAATKANKHSAFAGCDQTTRAAWELVLKGLDFPKVPSEHVLTTFIGVALDSAEGYLAYQALRLCSASQEDNFYKGGDIIGSDVVRRGPRTSTLAAWLASSSEIKFDNRDLKMDQLLGGGSYNDSIGLREGTRYQRVIKGVVAAIDEKDGFVEVSFKRTTGMIEDCVKWQQTNRIESISAGGGVNYQYLCKAWGKVKVDLTAKPVSMGKVMAQGLKPGMFLNALEEGLPIVATSGPDSAKAIWVFGGSVK